MRSQSLILVMLALLSLAPLSHANAASQDSVYLIAIDSIPYGMIDLNSGWQMRSGDNLEWAQPGLDLSGWSPITLGTSFLIPNGSTWYRLTVKLPSAQEPLALLLDAPSHCVEAYVDGRLAPGATIGSWLRIRRPAALVGPLPKRGGVVTIALRVHYPESFGAAYITHLSAELGGLSSVQAAANNPDKHILDFASSGFLNLCSLLGGIGALALYRVQRGRKEYFWLGMFLLAACGTTAPWGAQEAGLLSLSVNSLLADPLAWLMYIALIEFLFAFLGRKVDVGWRLVQAGLVAAIPVAELAATGTIPPAYYWVLEAFASLALSLAIPAFLIVQFLRGRREAGWLILPAALIAASVAQTDVNPLAQTLHIHLPFAGFFQSSGIFLGTLPVSYPDLGSFVFLLAIGVVMFFRFTQVSRDQARAAAELIAARSVQQILIPDAIASVPGFRTESVYKPAGEVGGDFFQILPTKAGGVSIVIGDVSGKGMPAAMTVSLLVGTFRTLAHYTQSPAEILRAMNQRMIGRNNGGFTTCLVVRVDNDGTLTIANAGHLAPYADGNEIPLENGLPLGLAQDAVYTETTLALHPSAQLTLLTDGVVEARNTSGELFGFDRTAALSTQSAEAIAAAAQSFGQEDDITVVTLTFAGVEVVHV